MPNLDEQLDVEQRVAGSGEPGAQHHEQALSALSALGPARPRPRPGAAARGRQRLQGQRRRVRHGPFRISRKPDDSFHNLAVAITNKLKKILN